MDGLHDAPLLLPEDLPQPEPVPIPDGWTENPFVIHSCLAPIETFILGQFFRLTQRLASLLLITKKKTEWAPSFFETPSMNRVQLQGIFAVLVCTYDAALNGASITAREAFYRLRNMERELRLTYLYDAAASVGVSRWQLGIFPDSEGNARWTGRMVSFLFNDGTELHGSDTVSFEIPPMYLVKAVRIDPALRLVQIIEGSWANRRCTTENYFRKLSRTFGTVGISTGGMASDNAKMFIKFLTDRLPYGSRAVIMVDGDPGGLRIVKNILFGSAGHLMDFRALKVEYCPILPDQWNHMHTATSYRKLDADATAVGRELQKTIKPQRAADREGNVARLQQDLHRMLSSGRKLSLSALIDIDGLLSTQVWAAVQKLISEPHVPSWKGFEPYIPQPLYSLTDIANMVQLIPDITVTPLDHGGRRIEIRYKVPTDPLLVITKLYANKSHIQLLTWKSDDANIRITADIDLGTIYRKSIGLDKLKDIQFIYDSMCTIASGSRDAGVQNMYKTFAGYFSALTNAIEPLRIRNYPVAYKTAETLLLIHILLDSVRNTHVPESVH
ncbi:hypothetical protein RSAG8_01183, partial [Rhizoctonia solani AG-8 WAC10335]